MAQFPYLVEDSFENAATAGALTDTQSKSLGYLHYTQSIGRYGVTPYRGAYLWGLDLSIGTKATACNQTYAAFNVDAARYWSFGFALYLKSPLTMANNNRFTVASCKATAAEECVVDILYTTAGGYQIVLDEVNDGTPTVLTNISLDKWHWVEVYGLTDNAGNNDGTANLALDGNLVGGLTALDQGAFTDLLIGAINQDAGTTAGKVFFDNIIGTGIDTSAVRVGWRSRTPLNPHISASEHLFVGPGTIRRIQLLTNTAADKLSLYDTDCANTTGAYPNLVAEIQVTATQALETFALGPFPFERGCYAVIAGTNPRAQVSLDLHAGRGYPSFDMYLSPANLRSYAMSERKRLPGDSI